MGADLRTAQKLTLGVICTKTKTIFTADNVLSFTPFFALLNHVVVCIFFSNSDRQRFHSSCLYFPSSLGYISLFLGPVAYC